MGTEKEWDAGNQEIKKSRTQEYKNARMRKRRKFNANADFNAGDAVKRDNNNGMGKMKSALEKTAIPAERIERRIFILRGHKVMLSTDLADLYEVEPRALVQAVKRNIERFPGDFMFQLDSKEFENLKSQIVISSWGGLRRAMPYAFT